MEKEDLAVELSAFNSHTDKGGYMLLAGATSADQVATLMEAINKILPMYNDGILAILP